MGWSGRKPEKSGFRSLHEAIHAKLWDRNFLSRMPHYLFQCGLATLALVIVLLVEDAVLRSVIIVVVAPTAFIIFAFPDSVAASPRKVLGGHVIGVVLGSLFAYLLHLPVLDYSPEHARFWLDVMAAFSVGLSILLMVATNTEHPPAAGTALGLVVYGFSWHAVAFVLVSALIMSLIRIVLRPKLVNLL